MGFRYNIQIEIDLNYNHESDFVYFLDSLIYSHDLT